MTDSTSGHEPDRERFPWTVFYEAIAKKLLDQKCNQKELIKTVRRVSGAVGLKGYEDKDKDGNKFPLQEACPYTVMGAFNRQGVAEEKRKYVAFCIAEFLGVEVAVPDSFEGVPCLSPTVLWPFEYEPCRCDGDITALWRAFVAAAQFVASDSPEHRGAFVEAYDAATEVGGVGWGWTMGLFW